MLDPVDRVVHGDRFEARYTVASKKLRHLGGALEELLALLFVGPFVDRDEIAVGCDHPLAGQIESWWAT
jgi:hypothetical protein